MDQPEEEDEAELTEEKGSSGDPDLILSFSAGSPEWTSGLQDVASPDDLVVLEEDIAEHRTVRRHSEYTQSYEELIQHAEDGPWNSKDADPNSLLTEKNKITYGSMTRVWPGMFLGSCSDASDLKALRKKGIKAILNVSFEIPNFFPNDFEYMNVPVDDFASTKLSVYFRSTSEFLDKCHQSKKTVLVHCAAGRSRSVSVLLAYMLRFQSVTLVDAFGTLRRKRDSVSPNQTFLRQLRDWETEYSSSGSSTYEQLPPITHPEQYYQPSNDLSTLSFRVRQQRMQKKRKFRCSIS